MSPLAEPSVPLTLTWTPRVPSYARSTAVMPLKPVTFKGRGVMLPVVEALVSNRA